MPKSLLLICFFLLCPLGIFGQCIFLDTSEVFITRSLSNDTIYFEGADAYGPYNTRTTVTLRGCAFAETLIIYPKYDIVFVTDNSGSMGMRQSGDRDWSDSCSRIQAAYNACANYIDSLQNPGIHFAHMYFSGITGMSCSLGVDAVLAKAKLDTFINGSQTVDGVLYGGAAIYTGIYNAIRYVATNFRKSEGSMPVVILLTDGGDNASGAYGTTTCASGYGYCWPSLQPNLGITESAVVDSVIKVIDSIRNVGIDLRVYTINISSVEDSAYLKKLAGVGAGQWQYTKTGTDMLISNSSVHCFNKFIAGKSISANKPMIVDALGPGIHFVVGSYSATAGYGYIVPRSCSIMNTATGQILSFIIDTIAPGQFLELRYEITAVRTTLAGGLVERKRVNNSLSDDSVIYSKIQYINSADIQIIKPIPQKYIFVHSLTDGVYFSTTPGVFTDPGRGIFLSFNQYDTAKYGPITLYSLLLQRGTGITQYTQVPANWDFSPISGWITSPVGGLTNSIRSFQTFGLTIAGDEVLAGQRSLSISYNDGNAVYTDSLIFNAVYSSDKPEKQPEHKIPDAFALSNPTPNPFNPTVTLSYAVSTQSPVSLTIFNVRGEVVSRLVGRMHEPGYYQAVWDGRDVLGRSVQSGLHVCRMEAGNFVQQRKMIMVK